MALLICSRVCGKKENPAEQDGGLKVSVPLLMEFLEDDKDCFCALLGFEMVFNLSTTGSTTYVL